MLKVWRSQGCLGARSHPKSMTVFIQPAYSCNFNQHNIFVWQHTPKLYITVLSVGLFLHKSTSSARLKVLAPRSWCLWPSDHWNLLPIRDQNERAWLEKCLRTLTMRSHYDIRWQKWTKFKLIYTSVVELAEWIIISIRVFSSRRVYSFL